MPIKFDANIPFGITNKFYLNFLKKVSTEVLFNRIIRAKEDYIIYIDSHVNRRFTWN